MIRQYWWKVLGVLLLLYAFTAGLLTPLKPGIALVKQDALSFRTGEQVKLDLNCYNARLEESEKEVRAWLVFDTTHAVSAQNIQVESDSEVELTFAIPEYLPFNDRARECLLLLDTPVAGAFSYEKRIVITQDSLNPARGKSEWVNAKVENLHSFDQFSFPFLAQLKETIRNLYFHVSLWFAMVIIFLAAVFQSIQSLRTSDPVFDLRALALTRAGILFGILGLATGAIWAKNTWGAYWSWDPKQNMTAVALLIYLAYFILRSSFEDEEKRARVSAVYNIFAFATLIPLIYVIPRMMTSLHPGAEGNPGLATEDLDNTMRMVFYPAIIGWILIGVWIASLSFRADNLNRKLIDREMDGG